MKILYFIHQFFPEYYTGTEKIFLGIMTMMQKAGCQVKIITYSFYANSFYEKSIKSILYKEFIYQGIPVLAIKQKKLPQDIHYSVENKALAKVAKKLILREKPDLVHIAHSMRMGELIKILPSLNIPYMVTLTDFFTICPKYTLLTTEKNLCKGPKNGENCEKFCPELSFLSIKHRLKTFHDILSQAKSITCPSKFTADLIKKEFSDLSIQIIPNGMKMSTIKFHKKIYSRTDKVVFGYAGSLNYHKGVHILIDAFKQLSIDTAKLKIYGSGSDQNYVREIKENAKLDSRIEFCGVYSEQELETIITSLDVIIIPSLWYEVYPMILQESLASHLPIIATKIGVFEEIIDHGVNGFLFNRGNENDLMEIIRDIIKKPEKLNDIKAQLQSMPIRTLAQEGYDYFKMYQKILN